MANSREQYALRYESKYLKEMGASMDYLFRIAVTQAGTEALKYTVLSGRAEALKYTAVSVDCGRNEATHVPGKEQTPCIVYLQE